MRCLSDGYERTGGTVAMFGRMIARTPPQGVVGFGIGRSFQTTSLFETLTVAECLRLARYRLNKSRMLSHAPTLTLPASARHVITATGLDRQLAIECRHLSHGMKRALELAMVLALEPSVLLLDEPTAGLTKSERTLIGSILVDLVQREGLCTLIIEHDLDFVREISTRIIVLHQGKILLDGSVAEVVGSELVRTIYAGSTQQRPAP
jgi:branched-chain amino acid transport system permease protein